MITTGYRRPWYGERHRDCQTATPRSSTESRSHPHVMAVRGYLPRMVECPGDCDAPLPRRRITRSCVRHRQRRAFLLPFCTAQHKMILLQSQSVRQLRLWWPTVRVSHHRTHHERAAQGSSVAVAWCPRQDSNLRRLSPLLTAMRFSGEARAKRFTISRNSENPGSACPLPIPYPHPDAPTINYRQ